MSFDRLSQYDSIIGAERLLQGRVNTQTTQGLRRPRVATMVPPMDLEMITLRSAEICPSPGVEPVRRSRAWIAMLVLPALAACSSNGTNPVDWWHSLEGGKIAEQRPPPPNVDAPYPNLGTVPARPAPEDSAARGKIATGLVADRSNAQYAATLAPLPLPPSAAARPVQASERPSDDQTSGATLDAANGPPPRVGPLGPPQPPLPNTPVTPPRPAARKSVQSSVLSPLPEPVASTSTVAPLSDARPAEPVSSLPAIADSPPPPPRLPGLAAGTVATPPPVAPPPPPPPVVAALPGAPVLVAFPSGSAVLPTGALGALKALGRQRGTRSIIVNGFGDATTDDTNAQSVALPLALARARAISSGLVTVGVPKAAIQVTAEAQGHGGAARLN